MGIAKAKASRRKRGPGQDQGYRNLSGTDVHRHDLLALRGPARRIALRPRVRLHSVCCGSHLTRFRGRGMEFDETRIYQAGDEIRNMDWRVTARTGQPHIKLFREEHERPVWLAVDLGTTMRFGTRGAFKSVRCAEAAALLAWSAIDGGDRLGALVFDDDRQRQLPPRGNHPGALGVIDAIAALAGPLSDNAGPHGRHHSPLDRLASVVRPGSLVFVLSDFSGLQRRQEVLLAHLAAHNELVLVMVYDPLEAEPPPPGRYPVSDGRRIVALDSGSEAAAAAHRRRFEQRWQGLQDLGRRYRMRSFQLTTEFPALGQLEAVL